MSSTVPYELIKAALAATTSQDLVEWESVVDNINQRETAFLSIEDLDSEETVVSIGTPDRNCMEEIGQIDIHYFVPSHQGFSPARVTADTVRNAMRMRKLDDHTWVQTVSPPSPGIIADGIWTSMVSTLQYRHRFYVPTYV